MFRRKPNSLQDDLFFKRDNNLEELESGISSLFAVTKHRLNHSFLQNVNSTNTGDLRGIKHHDNTNKSSNNSSYNSRVNRGHLRLMKVIGQKKIPPVE